MSTTTTTTTTTNNNNNINNSSDTTELTLDIPVWVLGKRKWVTGITKKTTFDDLIYALLAQAELLKTSGTTNSSSNNNITGYAIAECTQLTVSSSSNNNDSETPSLITQRIMKGRAKVIKAYKNWQFDKLPLTILHLISTSSLIDNNASISKFRSKIFRRFLSAKSQSLSPIPSLIPSSQSDSSLISIGNTQGQSQIIYRQKSINDIHENMNIIERQKRLLDCLDEKIHETENILTPISNNILTRNSYLKDSSIILNNEITLNDISRLFSHQIDQQDQLLFATQLCNSIINMQERIDEKTNILYAVEQAISNELNYVLHQQHYDILPCTLSSSINDNNNSTISNDLITLKNSIYRSRELSRIQSKEMHDFDLSLREIEILLATKYDELKYLEYETSSSNLMTTSRSLTPNYLISQNFRTNNIDEQPTYDTLDITTTGTNVVFTSLKEADEDSGINSLTSDDNNNNHTMSLVHQKLHTQNSQLETLV
ncbi:unnamed protein product [Rotaria sp. Silwood1]|nr:unnamed protein product [Rotaria sp. Silwood1]CAF0947022.1 unnamed protein product [Rotaria sp. Silwood1]CAF3376354.1 unnamed protein product [Rotaria sp. Silwood1]CAF3384207.1 unnamed protein product [Rotaria sp. Silwood1]CAF4573314.1 unnamed protein product [Rotaria sp. Silwood1]